MKIDDNILRERLQIKIVKIKELSREAQKDVEKWMATKYNVTYGVTAGIFRGQNPIEMQNYDMLYKLTASIKESLKERYMEIDLSDMNVLDYFTPIEVEQFQQPISTKNKNEDIVFTEWFQVNDDQYSTKASINEIIKWRNLNKIRYNEDTQRDMTIKNNKGVIIKVITINDEAIKAIFNLMKNNEFISDEITININTDINVESKQLPRIVGGNLVLPKESILDLLDGFHRYYTMCLVKDTIPDWEFTCKINITLYDTEKATRYMLQADEKTHLSKKQKKRSNKQSEENYIINRLKDSSNFHLRKTIDNDTHYDLNNLIGIIFNPKERPESVIIAKRIEKNINELVEEKDYYRKNFTKEEWFLYLYMIKKSQDNNCDFINLCNNINTENVADQISFTNKPSIDHYKLIDDKINEVI